MRRIAVANRKGGVGKTTSAVHLAAGLALAGRKVLLIDSDGQGHAARLLGLSPEHGLADVMDGRLSLTDAITTARPGLDLLAGGKALAGVNRLIARESIRPEELLTRALAGLEGMYEYVIVDTSPSFSELGVNVLFYAAEAVVPVSMEVLATEGLVSFAEEVRHVQEYHELAVRWILPTFVDGRTRKSAEILEALRDKYGDLVTFPVRYSSALSEASGWGKTIFEYKPRDRAAADYARIAGAVA
jgi:chromosome partitioning protein